MPQTGHRLYVEDCSTTGTVFVIDFGIGVSFLDIAVLDEQAGVALLEAGELASPYPAGLAEKYIVFPIDFGFLFLSHFQYLQPQFGGVIV